MNAMLHAGLRPGRKLQLQLQLQKEKLVIMQGCRARLPGKTAIDRLAD
jgi:hypothetical protein